ncbi:MAG: isochorismatase family protein [Frankiales bacterium]|nr:isochorismatase family protein [Frankiales bacterium]
MSPKPLPALPSETALLLVECQNGVIGIDSVLPDLAAVVRPSLPIIARLATGARDHGVQVVHLTFSPLAGNRSCNRKPLLFKGVLRNMDDWGPDNPATQVVDEIGVGPDDLVLPRATGLSPTYGTETFKLLRNIGIKAIVVAGVSTNIAIPAVLTEACDEGFDVLVPRDAALGAPADYAEQMMTHTIGMIARLTTVDELVAQWASTSVPA